jgi:hypothetical protein
MVVYGTSSDSAIASLTNPKQDFVSFKTSSLLSREEVCDSKHCT